MDDGDKAGCNFIAEDVKIGRGVTIGNFCVIEKEVEIGDDTSIGHFVYLAKGTKIGNNCKIDNYVRMSGMCCIGNDCTIRYGATIARRVTVKDNTFISPNVMTIYTDAQGKAMPGTVIGPNAFVGTAAVISGGIIIGSQVVIGAMSYVNRNCIEPGNYFGIPARPMLRSD